MEASVLEAGEGCGGLETWAIRQPTYLSSFSSLPPGVLRAGSASFGTT